MNEQERQALDYFRASLGEWALGDIRRAVEADIRVGAFNLAAPFIAALAALYSTKRGYGAQWDEFVAAFMPKYTGHRRMLYKGFRSAMAHHYSVDCVAFVHEKSELHLTESAGRLILNLETFVDDVSEAFEAFYAQVEADAKLRAQVVARIALKPPVTSVLFGAVSASGSTTTTSVAFFGGQGRSVPVSEIIASLRPAPSSTGRMAVPRERPKKARRPR